MTPLIPCLLTAIMLLQQPHEEAAESRVLNPRSSLSQRLTAAEKSLQELHAKVDALQQQLAAQPAGATQLDLQALEQRLMQAIQAVTPVAPPAVDPVPPVSEPVPPVGDPAANRDAPLRISKPRGTFMLQRDYRLAGAALLLELDEPSLPDDVVTIDLQGHTLTWNAAGAASTAGVLMGAHPALRVVIRNGAIVQAAVGPAVFIQPANVPVRLTLQDVRLTLRSCVPAESDTELVQDAGTTIDVIP